MSKKNKGIQPDTRILTIPDLIRRVEEEYEKRKKEIKIKQEAQKENLMAAIEEEKGLIRKIDDAKKIVKKMIREYQDIEIKVMAEKRAEAVKGAIREDDVKAGRATLKDFHSKGKRDSAISDETIKKSVAELEQSLKVIRGKNLEILQDKERLDKCRDTIRGLFVRPGISMLEMLKGLKEFTERETSEFISEMEIYRTAWNQTKQDLLLADGKSISGRHVWDRLTMEEAKALQFSPLLPLSCIEKLKLELAKYEGSENISITLYLRLKDIEITCVSARRGLIQTGNLKEDPDVVFKRKK